MKTINRKFTTLSSVDEHRFEQLVLLSASQHSLIIPLLWYQPLVCPLSVEYGDETIDAAHPTAVSPLQSFSSLHIRSLPIISMSTQSSSFVSHFFVILRRFCRLSAKLHSFCITSVTSIITTTSARSETLANSIRCQSPSETSAKLSL